MNFNVYHEHNSIVLESICLFAVETFRFIEIKELSQFNFKTLTFDFPNVN